MTSWPPDAFAALGIVLAVLLEWVGPVRVLPDAHWLGLVSWVGVVVAVVGFAIEAGAARALASAGTSTRAGAVASVLASWTQKAGSPPSRG